MRPILALTVAAVWLGAALLLAGSVAPAAFAVLPSRTLAGAVVGRVLPTLFLSGAVAGLAIAVSELLRSSDARGRGRGAAALVWAVACAVAQLGIAPRIDRLRRAIAGPVDALAGDDARRVAFGRLHGASVGLLGIGIVAAVCVVVLAALAAHDFTNGAHG
jgi:Domain of unknown function (DUF4149)